MYQKVTLLDQWHLVRENTTILQFSRGHHVGLRSMKPYIANEQTLRAQSLANAQAKRVGYKGHPLKYPELDAELFTYLALSNFLFNFPRNKK